MNMEKKSKYSDRYGKCISYRPLKAVSIVLLANESTYRLIPLAMLAPPIKQISIQMFDD